MVHLGLSNAATVRAGRADGAGRPAGPARRCQYAIALSVGFGVTMVILFLSFPEPLISLFLDTRQARAPRKSSPSASRCWRLAAMFQMADAMQVMALGLLRGIKDTRVPMWLAAISYWVIGIPVSYLLAFPLGYGAVGLWLGLVIGLTVAAVLLMTRFWLRAPAAD